MINYADNIKMRTRYLILTCSLKLIRTKELMFVTVE